MAAVLDTERLKSRKIPLCKFMNGKVKEDNGHKLSCRVLHRSSNTDLKTKDQMIMVSESPDMAYVGKNFGRNRCHSNHTMKSYVGVYDESTGKMRICDAELFHMMPYIPGRDDEDFTLPKEQNYVEKLGMLTEAFGSKWKKSALEKSQRNRVDAATMKDHLAADIDHGKEQVKIHQQQKQEKPSDTGLDVLPPCNKTAENVEDVYNLSDILSDIDMGSLQSAAAVFFDSTSEQLNEWRENQTYPGYILSHVSGMPLDPELRWKRSKCLIYLHYMIHMYKLTPKQLKEKDPFVKDCPGLIKKKLRENFTKEAVKTRYMPSRLKDRLAAYILTLCLLIDEFNLELGDIMKDMKLERNRLFVMMKSLGCKINKKVRNEEDIYIARLKLPLDFPQKLLFKQSSSKKR
ncbi:DNA-directed RNA polymerase I subunit RPA49-like [Mercenaria mercenaria]|uniref:DNA-directed RNA polymerase I subunit RPA49-like n=1 Tax=Mercenaria mercenaria TaxID=6596 RepID=UPI00234EA694|nr:DNA-directed RNA polymerase I subunit RPA49-like [Mercenaria mercenaria]